MRLLGLLALALLVNIGLFGWMRNLVGVEEQAPKPDSESAKVTLVKFTKRPDPKPKPQKSKPRPSLQKLAVPSSMPAMSQPKLAFATARASSALSSPVVVRPQLGPMSVKGKMLTGPAPGLASGIGAASGNAMQNVVRAAPEPTFKVPPRYPPEALREGIEGWVKVSFLIDTRGRPTKVRVQSAKPQELFDQAAVRAVRKWSYPKQSYPVLATVTLEFKMQDVQ